MLDIKFIRDNRDLVAKSSQAKGYKLDIDHLLQLDEMRKALLTRVEALRQQRNEIADQMGGGKPTPEVIEQGKAVKQELVELEAEHKAAHQAYLDLLEQVPNVIPDDTPEGGEESNRVERHWGETHERDFEVSDHLTLSENKDWLDFERGAKVSGSKFYFTKGDLALLEMALTQYVLTEASNAGFTPMLVPNMVNSRIAAGTGFMPRGEERQIYKIEDEDLNLIATAEMPLTGYHADEVLNVENGAITYVGYSPCYRLEAGAYGKHSKGLYRVHQFNKVELYAFCAPHESEAMHENILAFEEKICQNLGLPYRVVRIAAGDLGGPAYKKYDVEYWSPVDGEYRELMSCSNVTDYQARRLNIRCQVPGGLEFAHTLNGTAMPMSRGIIAILENYQQADGSVNVPDILRPFFQHRDKLT